MQEIFKKVIYHQNFFILMSRFAHWNVAGMFFYQYHLLFQRIYETLSANQDGLVELAKGFEVLIECEDFDVAGIVSNQDPSELVYDLIGYNEVFRASIIELHEAAEAENAIGVVNFIEGILTDLDTISYLLKSSIGVSEASITRRFPRR